MMMFRLHPLLALLLCAQFDSVRAETKTVGVAIIGGGIAGVAAARELENAGYHDWLLMEQEPRLGGRLSTERMGVGNAGCPVAGCPVEIGARYVQGIQRNPIWDILSSKEVDFRMHHVNYNKVLVYDEDVNEVKKPPFIQWDKAFGCAEELGDKLNQDLSADVVANGESLLDQCEWDNDSPVKDAIAWFDMEFEYGRRPEQFAAYAFPEYTYMNFRDADYYPADARGLDFIIEFFEKDIENGDIQKGCSCESIETEVDEADCQANSLDAGCVKITTDSDTIYAQWAITTIPFGVIKHNVEKADSTLFPNATQQWQDLVRKFIMGGYHSSYLRFSEKFWEDTEFIITASTKEPLDNIEEPVIGFKPYDPGHPVHYWPGSSILQANAGGDAADEFDRLCKDDPDKLQNIIIDRLDRMYNIDSADMLEEFTCTSWSQDESFRGAWFQYGSMATPKDYGKLFERQGNLLFSGEAVCRLYYGFYHGAMLAAWRDANIVLEEINAKDQPNPRYPVNHETRCDATPPGGKPNKRPNGGKPNNRPTGGKPNNRSRRFRGK